MIEYFAHSAPFPKGPRHTLQDHLAGVRRLAEGFAQPLGLAELADRCGMLHDLGKYGDLFQRRLQGLETGIDHWSAGAVAALTSPAAVPCALAIQGHHLGLQSGAKSALVEMCKLKAFPANLRLSSDDIDELLARARADGFSTDQPLPAQIGDPLMSDRMGFTRMLFSCLVDADFVDTEAHFAQQPGTAKTFREIGPGLEIDRAIEALDRHMAKLDLPNPSAVNALRRRVQSLCGQAAQQSPGIFTLSAPTGYGKTLAMLRFALYHAKVHNLRRIVVVLPFLNLIEETAKTYRAVFEGFPDAFVLEDHSLARDPEMEGDGECQNQLRLLAQNWDSPVVITTSVRLLESLHANRPSACRKLHRLGKAVVLVDEVQTLPTNLAVVTLATLSALSSRFGTTVVFATATQPAFDELDALVLKFAGSGWKPREIVADQAELFQHSKRVSVEWRTDPQSWATIADEIAAKPDTMAIVNLRRDAASLTALLAERGGDEPLYHLSTNMVVAHRRQVLDRVKLAPCRLIATQCVEAGVDLDFRRVFRAWAPLDSIAQAAGRCNRHGRPELGVVVVFTP